MRGRLSLGTAANILSILVYAFLLAPLVVVVLASFNSADLLSFPPRGFSLRWYRALWESEVWDARSGANAGRPLESICATGQWFHHSKDDNVFSPL